MTRGPSRKLAVLSWWMLPVFVVWTFAVILLTEPVSRIVFGFTPAQPGDTFYLEDWGPWIAMTLFWLAPVVAGIVLAGFAAKRGAGKLAWWAFAVHCLVLLFFTVPNVVDRLVPDAPLL